MAITYDTNGARESVRDRLKRGQHEAQEVRSDVQDFLSDVGTLAQMEMDLARAEMQESMGSLIRGAIFGGAAALLALVTLVFAATAVMLALDTFLPLWLAALITFGGLALLTIIGALIARSMFKSVSVAPQKTINSVQEDIKWARSQIRSSVR